MPATATRVVYRGNRDRNEVEVRVNGKQLPLRTDLKNYAEAFDWGRAGGEAAQLSLALLAHALNDAAALAAHQLFLAEVILSLTYDQWGVEKESIQNWFEQCKREYKF